MLAVDDLDVQTDGDPVAVLGDRACAPLRVLQRGGADIDPGTTGGQRRLQRLVVADTAGEFDLVAIGRAALMDADWIGKARRGEPFKPFDLSAYGRLD